MAVSADTNPKANTAAATATRSNFQLPTSPAPTHRTISDLGAVTPRTARLDISTNSTVMLSNGSVFVSLQEIYELLEPSYHTLLIDIIDTGTHVTLKKPMT